MQPLKEIKKRIGSVRNTMKIVGAMRMIATSKLKGLQGRVADARFFSDEVRNLALQVASKDGRIVHPAYILRKNIHHATVVVVTAERGFCGGLDERVASEIDDFLGVMRGRGVGTSLFLIGKRGARHFKKRGFYYESVDLGIEDPLLGIKIENLCGHMYERYMSGKTDQVIVAYSKFLSVIEHNAVLEMLLPIWVKKDERPVIADMVDFIYEPEKGEVADWLTMETMKAVLNQALLNGRTSEMAARMVAMNEALDNARDMVENLTRQYHRSRQAAITRELIDIVSGAEALGSS